MFAYWQAASAVHRLRAIFLGSICLFASVVAQNTWAAPEFTEDRFEQFITEVVINSPEAFIGGVSLNKGHFQQLVRTSIAKGYLVDADKVIINGSARSPKMHERLKSLLRQAKANSHLVEVLEVMEKDNVFKNVILQITSQYAGWKQQFASTTVSLPSAPSPLSPSPGTLQQLPPPPYNPQMQQPVAPPPYYSGLQPTSGPLQQPLEKPGYPGEMGPGTMGGPAIAPGVYQMSPPSLQGLPSSVPPPYPAAPAHPQPTYPPSQPVPQPVTLGGRPTTGSAMDQVIGRCQQQMRQRERQQQQDTESVEQALAHVAPDLGSMQNALSGVAPYVFLRLQEQTTNWSMIALAWLAVGHRTSSFDPDLIFKLFDKTSHDARRSYLSGRLILIENGAANLLLKLHELLQYDPQSAFAQTVATELQNAGINLATVPQIASQHFPTPTDYANWGSAIENFFKQNAHRLNDTVNDYNALCSYLSIPPTYDVEPTLASVINQISFNPNLTPRDKQQKLTWLMQLIANAREGVDITAQTSIENLTDKLSMMAIQSGSSEIHLSEVALKHAVITVLKDYGSRRERICILLATHGNINADDYYALASARASGGDKTASAQRQVSQGNARQLVVKSGPSWAGAGRVHTESALTSPPVLNGELNEAKLCAIANDMALEWKQIGYLLLEKIHPNPYGAVQSIAHANMMSGPDMLKNNASELLHQAQSRCDSDEHFVAKLYQAIKDAGIMSVIDKHFVVQ